MEMLTFKIFNIYFHEKGLLYLGKMLIWPRQDSNLQSPDPKSGALSIRPQDLIGEKVRYGVDHTNIISIIVAIVFKNSLK